MAKPTTPYGSVLLNLNTSRPPDLLRGANAVHVSLDTPAPIAAEIGRWQADARPAVSPREAADLLWQTKVAASLRQLRSWEAIPGLGDALSLAWGKLRSLDEASAPKDQDALRTFVVSEVPGVNSIRQLLGRLTKESWVESLNDLVLLFKYATTGTERPLGSVASLFLLARTLAESGTPPATSAEVYAWLHAPIVAPAVFVKPARPVWWLAFPGARDSGSGRTPGAGATPDPSLIAAITRDLDGKVSELEEIERATLVVETLERAGAREWPAVRGRFLGMPSLLKIGPESSAHEVRLALQDRKAEVRRKIVGDPIPGSAGATARLVRSSIAGVPVILDPDRYVEPRNWPVSFVGGLEKLLPGDLVDRLRGLGISPGDVAPEPSPEVFPEGPSYLEPAGRSDLLLVRQTTIGYRRAEIGHVETVMVGESRNRELTHRVLSEREFLVRAEQETEETRDLQQTDRAELSREVEEVVKEDLKASGSVKVTSRGPTTVVATASVAYERSTEEAARQAEEYARETIERASKRTLQKTMNQVRTLFEEETTEVSSHGFQRASDAKDHAIGVYQYLERVSRAKIFSYGERELYDILVPEPAALLWHLAVKQRDLHIAVLAPDEQLFNSITVDNIAERREAVIKAFRVADLPPVPEPTRTISQTWSATGKGDEAKFAASRELDVPAGYQLETAVFAVSAEVEDEDDKPNGGITVGNDVRVWSISISGNKGQTKVNFSYSPPLPGPSIGVGFNADNFTSLVASVTLNCRITDEAIRGWALDAYGRVSQRYEQMRIEYEQAIRQATAVEPQTTTDLPQGTRERLDAVMRFEVQLAAMAVIRNEPIDFDLIARYVFQYPDGTSGSHPMPDLIQLHEFEPEIRFLQVAFEWEHASWVLYPYFWGRRSEWAQRVLQEHADPDFTMFLKAGAARVQIPVRPGFERYVKHYMETGEAYGGNDLPHMGDEGYVSFIDEQLTQLAAPGTEFQWPKDDPREWNVVQATPLVTLRSTAEKSLPTWDPATGDET